MNTIFSANKYYFYKILVLEIFQEAKFCRLVKHTLPFIIPLAVPETAGIVFFC